MEGSGPRLVTRDLWPRSWSIVCLSSNRDAGEGASEREHSPGRLDAVQDAVRKAVDQTTSDLSFQHRPGVWIGQDVAQSREDFQRELLPEGGLDLVVEGDRLDELLFGFRVEMASPSSGSPSSSISFSSTVSPII
jgi:hypothetical protein